MSSLPNAENAIIESAKLTDYILNPAHKEGWPKGRLLGRLGFDLTDPESLMAAILVHVRGNPVSRTNVTTYGVKYCIDGPVTPPTGRVAQIRTVWQIDAGQSDPRFVTLKPLKAQT